MKTSLLPFTYATVLQAELAWGSSEPWEAVRARDEARTKAAAKP